MIKASNENGRYSPYKYREIGMKEKYPQHKHYKKHPTPTLIREKERPTIELLEPESLILKPETQLRYETGSIEELAQELLAMGQLQPIIINQRNEVIAGNRRTLALRRINTLRRSAGVDTMQIHAVRRVVKDDEEAALINLHENFDRRELSPMDVAHTIGVLRGRFGYTDTKIAAIFGHEQPWVSRKAQLLQVPKSVQNQVHTGVLSEDAALALIHLPEIERENLAFKAVQQGRKITAALVKRRVRELKPAESVTETKRYSRTMPEMRELMHRYSQNSSTALANVFRVLLMWQSGQISDEVAIVECERYAHNGCTALAS